ncbi:MAG TPA: dTDP-4-amino-4,6-dideoxygalactose transaminase, partial [Micropepsaceae bacterium]|nr:dTDP-4-amino-4,6-dideoxygalactose transaminase [Micropepsaceae bacterium]
SLAYVQESLQSRRVSGDGPFTARCHQWLERELGSPALLTHSCTAALEMSALLAEIGPGSEVILPSYTFPSTANAFVLRGATPVFVDIRADTLNLDESLLDQALSRQTKAIVAVHYAGVGCAMNAILEFAAEHGLMVIEDAAQAHMSRYRGKALGTFGAVGCLSFHESKNLMSGEGGALIINDQRLVERAYILREKGTNRTAFFNGKVGKYEWLDFGSSYLPSDLIAALLLAQLEDAEAITARRVAIWSRYQDGFAAAERDGLLLRPHPPADAPPNGHIYYILLPTADAARRTQRYLETAGVEAHTHYVPLHSAPAGRRFGRTATAMPVTERVAGSLLRLPLHTELQDDDVEHVIAAVYGAVSSL